MREDKRLVLGSEAGQAGGHYDIADSEEEALEDSDLYFVSKNTFVIERTKTPDQNKREKQREFRYIAADIGA